MQWCPVVASKLPRQLLLVREGSGLRQFPHDETKGIPSRVHTRDYVIKTLGGHVNAVQSLVLSPQATQEGKTGGVATLARFQDVPVEKRHLSGLHKEAKDASQQPMKGGAMVRDETIWREASLATDAGSRLVFCTDSASYCLSLTAASSLHPPCYPGNWSHEDGRDGA